MRQRADLNLEALLNGLEGVQVALALGVYKGHRQPFGSEAACTAHAVQLLVAAVGDVVVDDHVDLADVDAA